MTGGKRWSGNQQERLLSPKGWCKSHGFQWWAPAFVSMTAELHRFGNMFRSSCSKVFYSDSTIPIAPFTPTCSEIYAWINLTGLPCTVQPSSPHMLWLIPIHSRAFDEPNVQKFFFFNSSILSMNYKKKKKKDSQHSRKASLKIPRLWYGGVLFSTFLSRNGNRPLQGSLDPSCRVAG